MTVNLTTRRILDVATRSPRRVAVVAPGHRLTYGQLVDRALSWYAALAPHASEIVAVLRSRDADVPASQLGIWLHGAAYLPLAPDLPAARIAQLLDDADCTTVVTTRELAARLPAETTALTAPGPAGPRSPSWDVDGLAYLIYTSGSTGRPKGVVVDHRSLSHLLTWYRSAYGIDEDARTGLFNGLGFDASVVDTWAPLTAGGELHIPEEQAIRDVAALTETIAAGGVTQCLLSTPMAELLLQAGTCPQSLRTLVLGGDRLRVWPPESFPAAVHNLYGPTENTVVSTGTGDLRRHPGRAAGGPPPIGSPRGQVRVELRDQDGQTVRTAGTPGELWLAGPQLARCYWRAPETTAVAFVADGEGERWYRSGDVCSWTGDGELAFHGRVDGQVQVRGFRVEPGEVEHVLLALPGVRQGAVAAVEDADAMALAAWYRGPDAPDEVRHELTECLPAYMVPRHITRVDELPLTPNGKIDRTALAATVAADAPTGRAPEGELENLVAETWREIIGSAPARDSDFFALGGQSLLANQVTVRLRQRLGVAVPLEALFSNPRLDAYAAAVAGLIAARQPFADRMEASTTARCDPLVVIYDRGSLSPYAILVAVRDRCDVVFLADLSRPQLAADLAEPPAGARVVDIAGMDEAQVCRRAAALRPGGVITFSDSTLRLAAAIARRCRLPFHSPNVTLALVDKLRQRRVLSDAGVQSTACAPVRTAADLPAALAEVGLPAVLKPRFGADSVGTCLVRSLPEAMSMLDAVAAAVRQAGFNADEYVVEEYLLSYAGADEGPWSDYASVESVVQDGVVTTVGVTGKLPMVPPFREAGMFIPAAIDGALADRIIQVERAALDALGIRHGVIHTEVKLTPDGPRVIGVNGRLGRYVSDLVARAAGVDLRGIAVRLALGDRVEVAPAYCPAVAFQNYVTPPHDFVTPGPPAMLDELGDLPGVDQVDAGVPAGWTPDWRMGTERHLGVVYGLVAGHEALLETVTMIRLRLDRFWIPTTAR